MSAALTLCALDLILRILSPVSSAATSTRRLMTTPPTCAGCGIIHKSVVPDLATTLCLLMQWSSPMQAMIVVKVLGSNVSTAEPYTDPAS
jgi:hypothetical protein